MSESLLEYRLVINAELANALEEHFCEEYQTCWLLHEDEKTKVHELRGYFADADTAISTYGLLRASFPTLPDQFQVFKELTDKDWREAYKLHFHPWKYQSLHFVPVWQRDSYEIPAGEDVIWLDPGMAFGTGNHETTRLCLFRLLDVAADWGADRCAHSDVIDAGCGSGILALAAKKCGYGKVEGFDLDPDSVRISIENAELCELNDAVEFKWCGLEEGLGSKQADIVLANILANVLCAHSSLLLNAVRSRGVLILSGILARELADVRSHFEAAALECWLKNPRIEFRTEGDWAEIALFRA
ncbi:MAG: 50S ribosomal protein L11 methyltransferase [Verrucomicrobia bacterium]|nr:50S ribosomal protein L11 methyltransferase [Verrucomicrobiota bacterium]